MNEPLVFRGLRVPGAPTDENISRQRGGGGAMGAPFLALLAFFSIASARRRVAGGKGPASWNRAARLLALIGSFGLLSSAQTAFGGDDGNALEHFNDLDGAFVVSNGEARRSAHEGEYTEDRHYLTTARSDYLLSDWVYEVNVRSPTDGPPDILFIGIGSGRPDPTFFNEPANSLEFRIHQGWIGGRVDVAANPTGGNWTYAAPAIGFLPAHSGKAFTEFTARIAKVGNTIKFSICTCPSDSAPCEPEFFDEIPDLATAAPFLISGNTYLFLGNGSGSYVYTKATILPGPASIGIDGGFTERVTDGGGSVDASSQTGGGGTIDALLLGLLAQFAFAAALRRRA